MWLARIRLGVFVIVMTAVVASACAGTGGGVAQDGSGWTRLPEAPLSPRYGTSAFWIDGRIYILGGRDSAPCPPNADCALQSEPALTDGAAFEPGTSTWRRIADAPVAFEHASGVVIGETLYAWVVELAVDDLGMAARRGTFVAYHAGEDRWEELPPPPVEDWWGPQLVAGGTRVIAFRGSHEDGHREDLVYDPSARTWSLLDPFADQIAALLDTDPKVPATVVLQHLRRDGYAGGITILKSAWPGFVRSSWRRGPSSARATCRVRSPRSTGGTRERRSRSARGPRARLSASWRRCRHRRLTPPCSRSAERPATCSRRRSAASAERFSCSIRWEVGTGNLAEAAGQLPDIGERSWYVDVVCLPVGSLGTYRRSRRTGHWFAGHHRFHEVGN